MDEEAEDNKHIQALVRWVWEPSVLDWAIKALGGKPLTFTFAEADRLRALNVRNAWFDPAQIGHRACLYFDYTASCADLLRLFRKLHANIKSASPNRILLDAHLLSPSGTRWSDGKDLSMPTDYPTSPVINPPGAADLCEKEMERMKCEPLAIIRCLEYGLFRCVAMHARLQTLVGQSQFAISRGHWSNAFVPGLPVSHSLEMCAQTPLAYAQPIQLDGKPQSKFHTGFGGPIAVFLNRITEKGLPALQIKEPLIAGTERQLKKPALTISIPTTIAPVAVASPDSPASLAILFDESAPAARATSPLLSSATGHSENVEVSSPLASDRRSAEQSDDEEGEHIAASELDEHENAEQNINQEDNEAKEKEEEVKQLLGNGNVNAAREVAKTTEGPAVQARLRIAQAEAMTIDLAQQYLNEGLLDEAKREIDQLATDDTRRQTLEATLKKKETAAQVDEPAGPVAAAQAEAAEAQQKADAAIASTAELLANARQDSPGSTMPPTQGEVLDAYTLAQQENLEKTRNSNWKVAKARFDTVDQTDVALYQEVQSNVVDSGQYLLEAIQTAKHFDNDTAELFSNAVDFLALLPDDGTKLGALKKIDNVLTHVKPPRNDVTYKTLQTNVKGLLQNATANATQALASFENKNDNALELVNAIEKLEHQEAKKVIPRVQEAITAELSRRQVDDVQGFLDQLRKIVDDSIHKRILRQVLQKAQKNNEAQRKAQAEAEAEQKAAQAETQRKAQAEADAKQKAAEQAEAQRKAKEDAEAAAQAEAQRKAQADAEAKQKAAAEAEAQRKAQADAEAKQKAAAQAEAQRKAQAEAEAKQKAAVQAEAQRKAQAEAEAKQNAAAQAQRKAQAAATANAVEYLEKIQKDRSINDKQDAWLIETLQTAYNAGEGDYKSQMAELLENAKKQIQFNKLTQTGKYEQALALGIDTQSLQDVIQAQRRAAALINGIKGGKQSIDVYTELLNHLRTVVNASTGTYKQTMADQLQQWQQESFAKKAEDFLSQGRLKEALSEIRHLNDEEKQEKLKQRLADLATQRNQSGKMRRALTHLKLAATQSANENTDKFSALLADGKFDEALQAINSTKPKHKQQQIAAYNEAVMQAFRGRLKEQHFTEAKDIADKLHETGRSLATSELQDAEQEAKAVINELLQNGRLNDAREMVRHFLPDKRAAINQRVQQTEQQAEEVAKGLIDNGDFDQVQTAIAELPENVKQELSQLANAGMEKQKSAKTTFDRFLQEMDFDNAYAITTDLSRKDRELAIDQLQSALDLKSSEIIANGQLDKAKSIAAVLRKGKFSQIEAKLDDARNTAFLNFIGAGQIGKAETLVDELPDVLKTQAKTKLEAATANTNRRIHTLLSTQQFEKARNLAESLPSLAKKTQIEIITQEQERIRVGKLIDSINKNLQRGEFVRARLEANDLPTQEKQNTLKTIADKQIDNFKSKGRLQDAISVEGITAQRVAELQSAIETRRTALKVLEEEKLIDATTELDEINSLITKFEQVKANAKSLFLSDNDITRLNAAMTKTDSKRTEASTRLKEFENNMQNLITSNRLTDAEKLIASRPRLSDETKIHWNTRISEEKQYQSKIQQVLSSITTRNFKTAEATIAELRDVDKTRLQTKLDTEKESAGVEQVHKLIDDNQYAKATELVQTLPGGAAQHKALLNMVMIKQKQYDKQQTLAFNGALDTLELENASGLQIEGALKKLENLTKQYDSILKDHDEHRQRANVIKQRLTNEQVDWQWLTFRDRLRINDFSGAVELAKSFLTDELKSQAASEVTAARQRRTKENVEQLLKAGNFTSANKAAIDVKDELERNTLLSSIQTYINQQLDQHISNFDFSKAEVLAQTFSAADKNAVIARIHDARRSRIAELVESGKRADAERLIGQQNEKDQEELKPFMQEKLATHARAQRQKDYKLKIQTATSLNKFDEARAHARTTAFSDTEKNELLDLIDAREADSIVNDYKQKELSNKATASDFKRFIRFAQNHPGVNAEDLQYAIKQSKRYAQIESDENRRREEAQRQQKTDDERTKKAQREQAAQQETKTMEAKKKHDIELYNVSLRTLTQKARGMIDKKAVETGDLELFGQVVLELDKLQQTAPTEELKKQSEQLKNQLWEMKKATQRVPTRPNVPQWSKPGDGKMLISGAALQQVARVPEVLQPDESALGAASARSARADELKLGAASAQTMQLSGAALQQVSSVSKNLQPTQQQLWSADLQQLLKYAEAQPFSTALNKQVIDEFRLINKKYAALNPTQDVELLGRKFQEWQTNGRDQSKATYRADVLEKTISVQKSIELIDRFQLFNALATLPSSNVLHWCGNLSWAFTQSGLMRVCQQRYLELCIAWDSSRQPRQLKK